MFKKILVANRGEIACRVMRTARQLGIETVAIYSEADRDALHVRTADEAMRVGPPPAAQSYLNIERIVEAARRTGAEAVHPGYGFLSENTAFAKALAEAGITFVGPPVDAIAAMGSKSEAKRIMIAAGVPTLPSYHDADQTAETLLDQARRIGFPVLLKAVAGGGGKGMRRVNAEAEFAHALDGARREGEAAFGDPAVLVEKFLEHPRHVEVQVFADAHGNAIAVFERDCSLQRRYQKVIEEAPAPGLTAATRSAMGEAAVAAAQAIGYVGAGTVEFLLGPEQAFYFLEMNTRLQVEHPVTEMVTGEDLVAWQLAVAAGRPLPKTEADLRLEGHAFEARVYAEDPERDFLPAPGRLERVSFPTTLEGIRVDTGVESGDTIPVHYDPMIAKVVAFGPDRETARRRLIAALEHTFIDGPRNNLAFLAALASAPEFVAGPVDTGFIDRRGVGAGAAPQKPELIALAGLYLALAPAAPVPVPGDPFSPWARRDRWRLNQAFEARVTLEVEGADAPVQIAIVGIGGRGAHRYRVSAGGREFEFDGVLAEHAGGLTVERDGHRYRAEVTQSGHAYVISSPAGRIGFAASAPDLGAPAADELAGCFTAPMAGNVVAVLVEPGASVEAGTPLVVIEAMKMEHTLTAPSAGRVRALYYAAGDFVEGGVEVLAFESDAD